MFVRVGCSVGWQTRTNIFRAQKRVGPAMLVRVHFRVGKLGPHISLRSFRMLVRVGCDEMFVRVTVSDPYKQKPAQHCPLLRPSSEGGGPVQTFDVQTSGGAAAAARTEKYFPVADVWTSECWDGNFGEVGTSYVCTCRVRDPECLYGSGRAYPYKHSGGGPVQTSACTGPLREMFVRVCFFCIRVPPPASSACRDLWISGASSRVGARGGASSRKKVPEKVGAGRPLRRRGLFWVIMVLAAPQSGLKGGPVQTFRKVRKWSLLQNVNVGAGPLLWMLGRVHCSNVCTGPPLDDFWQNKHPGCDFSPSHTWTRTNIPPSQHPLFLARNCLYGYHYARGGDDVGTGPLPQGGKVPAEAGPTFMIFMHKKPLSEVGTGRPHANVCTGKPF